MIRLVLFAWLFPDRPGVLASARYTLALRCLQ
jgi:hypothetical protein